MARFTKKELYEQYKLGITMVDIAKRYRLPYAVVRDIVQRQVPNYLKRTKEFGFEVKDEK